MQYVTFHASPTLHHPRLVLGFTGWMDGGHVSTGTIEHLIRHTHAQRLAEIDSLEFYIFNFPVSTVPTAIISDGETTVLRSLDPMQQAAIFRPHTKITDGIVREFTYQRNDFWFSEDANLILFSGAEPHIRWRTFADCMFHVVERCGVRELYFVGSVASPIPHTREPRVRSSFSSEALRDRQTRPDVGATTYEGPASFVTMLTRMANERGLEMRTLVVEIPHYPFLDVPAYPGSILRVLSLLAEFLGLQITLSDLRASAERLRERIDEVMRENEDFRELVKKLEEAYDAEETSEREDILRRLIDGIDAGGNGQRS